MSNDLKVLHAEMGKFKTELRRTTEERDILKSRSVPCQAVRMKYIFIHAPRSEFKLTCMCRVLRVHRSGFYSWPHGPQSPRAKANDSLPAKIREFYDQRMGIWLFVAFVTDVFVRRIVGWSVSSSMRTDFELDALQQALFDRQPERDEFLVHHSDRGSQYESIRYTERLAEAGIEPSVGSRGDSYDNALAETINWLYKAE